MSMGLFPMQHHPAIVERSVGIQCYLLEYVIRKWCKCTGCLYTGQIPIVLLSIAKNGYKLLLSLYPGHLARWICSSFCQEVGLFTYPLNVSWPCGLIWPTARGRSLDVSIPGPQSGLQEVVLISTLSLESLPPPGEQAQTSLLEDEMPLGGKAWCPGLQ